MGANATSWRRRAIGVLLFAPVMLAGCGSSQIQACEERLLGKLKSPASYKRISAETVQIDESIHKPPYDSVTITYDAANSFNALLRDKEYCTFRPGTTEWVEPFSDANLDLNAIDPALDLNAAAENLEAQADFVDANMEMPAMEDAPAADEAINMEELANGADE